MALNVMFLVFYFVSLFLGQLAFHDERTLRQLFVTPDNENDAYKGVYSHNCSTLSSYARRGEHGFNFNNTEFIFFSGVHRLENDVVFDGLFAITLKAAVTNHSDSLVFCIECADGVGFIFSNIIDLVIVGLTFRGCGTKPPKYADGIKWFFQDFRAGLYFDSITNLMMTNTVVEKSVGYGVVLVQIVGSSFITNCNFYSNGRVSDNCSSGGNALLVYYKCLLSSEYTPHLNIEYVTFSDGESRTGSASGLIILFLTDACINIHMAHTIMNGNNAGENAACSSDNKELCIYGGNMAVINYSQNHTTIFITNSSFSEGKAVLGGGLFVHYNFIKKHNRVFKIWMMLVNCSFVSNKAYSGGGAYFKQTGHHLNISSISISHSVFVKNAITGAGGAAIVAYYIDINYGHSSMINIINCNITDNKGERHYLLDQHLSFSLVSAALLIHSVSNLLIENTIIEHNQITGVCASSSLLIFQGDVSISNNTNCTGIGGGIFFSDLSIMVLRPHTTVTIAQNSASYNGGGLFVEDYYYLVSPLCFFMIDSENKIDQNGTLDSIHVLLVNNSAGYAGQQLYGGQIDNCVIDPPMFNRDEVLERVFTFYPNTDHSFISSDPQNVYFCDKNHNTKNQELSMTIYSGELVKISLMLTGQRNGTVPGIVEFTEYHEADRKTSISSIAEISSGCAPYTLHVTALTNTATTRTIIVTIQVACSYTSFIPKSYLHIDFLPTPFGFQSNKREESWIYICIKQPPIEQHGFECKIENNQSFVLRPTPYWLGYAQAKNDSIETVSTFVLHMHCPQGYCKDKNVSIRTDSEVFHQDDQCSNNRTGVLCGRCQPELSLSMGTSECLNCTHFSVGKTLALSLAYGLAAVILVCIILLLNLTVTEGTMSGFLFYVNSMFIFWPVLSSQCQSSVQYILHHLIAATNIVFGPNYCFYDGMDLVGLTWVRFANVAFLWVMTGAIVILGQRFQWASNFVSRRTVPVLATMVLLSHAKLNISIIITVTPSVLKYYSPDGNMLEPKYVMYYDGNVPYGGKKHLPLLVVGVLLGVVSLCFTFLVLCIQPLQRYSHLKCLQWVNRLKPFFDAYSCPHIVKPHCRFWNGFLLIQRSIMYFVYTWIGNYPQKILSTIFCVCVTILFMAWLLGGVYKEKHLRYLNFSYIVNLGVLCLLLKELKFYKIVDGNDSMDLYAVVLYIVSVTITFITFWGTIFYHLYLQMHGSRLSSCMVLKLRQTRRRVRRLCRRNNGYQDLDDYTVQPGQEGLLLRPSYSNVSVLLVKHATSPQLREPLLMD